MATSEVREASAVSAMPLLCQQGIEPLRQRVECAVSNILRENTLLHERVSVRLRHIKECALQLVLADAVCLGNSGERLAIPQLKQELIDRQAGLLRDSAQDLSFRQNEALRALLLCSVGDELLNLRGLLLANDVVLHQLVQQVAERTFPLRVRHDAPGFGCCRWGRAWCRRRGCLTLGSDEQSTATHDQRCKCTDDCNEDE